MLQDEPKDWTPDALALGKAELERRRATRASEERAAIDAVRSRLQSLTQKDRDSIIAAVQEELNMQFYRGFDYSQLQKGSDPISAMREIGQAPQDEDAAIKAVAQQRGLDIAVVNSVWQARTKQ